MGHGQGLWAAARDRSAGVVSVVKWEEDGGASVELADLNRQLQAISILLGRRETDQVAAGRDVGGDAGSAGLRSTEGESSKGTVERSKDSGEDSDVTMDVGQQENRAEVPRTTSSSRVKSASTPSAGADGQMKSNSTPLAELFAQGEDWRGRHWGEEGGEETRGRHCREVIECLRNMGSKQGADTLQAASAGADANALCLQGASLFLRQYARVWMRRLEHIIPARAQH